MGRLTPGWTVGAGGRAARRRSRRAIFEDTLRRDTRPEDAKRLSDVHATAVPAGHGRVGARAHYEQPLWLLLAIDRRWCC